MAHAGGHASGDFCHTLTIADVDTGWVELHGLKNKAQRWTHAARQDARLTLPIPIKGIDTDYPEEKQMPKFDGNLFPHKQIVLRTSA